MSVISDKDRRKVEAAVLKQASDALVAHCPDHGNQEQTFIACPCIAADELARWVIARGGAA